MEKLRKLKPVLVGAIVLVAAVILVQNQEPVETRVLLWSAEMPRFALLGGVYLLGVATGWIVRWRSARGG
jgi:uncharacterized membrane protein YciS (DUF1049 family)